MKRLAFFSVTFFAAVAAYPQTPPADWSWTFLRAGETCGLLFEDTNLTAPVKAAIRDDVAWSYSYVGTSNLFTRLYVSGDSEYGIFIGVDGTIGNNGCAEGLGGWDYKLHNGNRYFHVEKKLSERFLQAIALTNQHQAAVESLTNFLHAFNSTTTNNVVPAEYLQLWWTMKTERAGSLSDFKSDASFQKFFGAFSGYELIVPSILNFWYRNETFGNGLWCETQFRAKDNGRYKKGYDIAFRNGSWRLVLPEY